MRCRHGDGPPLSRRQVRVQRRQRGGLRRFHSGEADGRGATADTRGRCGEGNLHIEFS